MKNNKLLAEYLGYSSIRIGFWGDHNRVDNEYYESQDQRDLGEDYLDKVGIQDVGNYYLKYDEKKWFYEQGWIPNKDWNQLMMVVEKIEKTTPTFYFELWNNVPKSKSPFKWECVLWEGGMILGGNTMIEAVYNACVEYIKSKS